MSLRNRALWLGIGSAAALLVVAILMLNRYQSGGPLSAVTELEVGFPLPARSPGTWGVVLPPNDSAAPIAIESVELVDVEGLEVIDILANDPDREGAIGLGYGFPPDGLETHPLPGSVVPAASGASRHLQLLIGVIRSSGSDGSIGGIRVRYTRAGERFEDVLPWSLRVFDPPA